MNKRNSLIAYILIGIGIYFLFREWRLPLFTDFYSWTTLLIIVGLALVIHGYTSKLYDNLFSGSLLLGIGIHLHGNQHYQWWIDHWGVYLLLVGLAFIIKSTKTKDGFITGLLLTSLSILLIFSIQLPEWLSWIYIMSDFLENFWPLILIFIGIYLLKRKKKK
ncbi:LiaI-LiaF-like domain-containing protein [Virgibacillus sediminis]|uniref:LiaI-LiaF-like domain-containing protein n=1 Tax=Virgibacillus sediminis TaxID=202260 RepID=A0ABV7A664_9BACI